MDSQSQTQQQTRPVTPPTFPLRIPYDYSVPLNAPIIVRGIAQPAHFTPIYPPLN